MSNRHAWERTGDAFCWQLPNRSKSVRKRRSQLKGHRFLGSIEFIWIMEKATPTFTKEEISLLKAAGVGAVAALVAVAMLMFAVKDTRSKRGRITSPPGVATGLRQIQWATVMYHAQERKNPSSLDDLIGIEVPTSEGQTTQFSISLLEQQLGGKRPRSSIFRDLGFLVTVRFPPKR
jgi:hypothetical protein